MLLYPSMLDGALEFVRQQGRLRDGRRKWEVAEIEGHGEQGRERSELQV
jgi:hypothetical protein